MQKVIVTALFGLWALFQGTESICLAAGIEDFGAMVMPKDPDDWSSFNNYREAPTPSVQPAAPTEEPLPTPPKREVEPSARSLLSSRRDREMTPAQRRRFEYVELVKRMFLEQKAPHFLATMLMDTELSTYVPEGFAQALKKIEDVRTSAPMISDTLVVKYTQETANILLHLITAMALSEHDFKLTGVELEKLTTLVIDLNRELDIEGKLTEGRYREQAKALLGGLRTKARVAMYMVLLQNEHSKAVQILQGMGANLDANILEVVSQERVRFADERNLSPGSVFRELDTLGIPNEMRQFVFDRLEDFHQMPRRAR